MMFIKATHALPAKFATILALRDVVFSNRLNKFFKLSGLPEKLLRAGNDFKMKASAHPLLREYIN